MIINILKFLVDMFYYTFLIFLVTIIIYLFFKPLFKGAYPRITTIGSSVDIIDYSTTYLINLNKNIRTIIYDIDDKTKQNEYKDLLKLGILPENNVTRMTPENFPILYMFLGFKNNILDNKKKTLVKWKSIFKTTSVNINKKKISLYDENKIEIIEEHFETIKTHLKKLNDFFIYFKTLKNVNTVKNDKSQEMALREIQLLLSYEETIYKIYENRKASGFYLIGVYGREICIATGQKFRTWKEWGDLNTISQTIREVLGGEKAQAFMQKLVLKMAGVPDDEIEEAAKEQESKAEEQGGGGGGGGGGPFGEVIAAAIGFATIFVAIGESIMKLVTNPMSIIQFILGLIAGITIYLIWFLLFVVLGSVLSYAFAAVALFSIKWFISGIAIIFFIFNAIIYVFIAIIDIPLKGAISRSMRCENLPDIWHTLANTHLDNKNDRRFFCNKACAKRYIPSKDYWWCEKLKRYHPSFCPQANIYNMYLLNKQMGSKVTNPLYFDYKPNISYFKESERNQLNIIKKSFEERVDFISICDKKLNNYDFLNKYICNNVDELIKDPTLAFTVKKLCKLSYCELDINDNGDASLFDSSTAEKNDCGFCVDVEDKKLLSKDIIERASTSNNIFIKVVSMIYFMVFVLILVRIILQLSENCDMNTPSSYFD